MREGFPRPVAGWARWLAREWAECRDSESLFNDRLVIRFRAIERVARRKLLYLHAVRRLEDLRVPPGNRLEALRGDRAGQHSIRINDQWRICFV